MLNQPKILFDYINGVWSLFPKEIYMARYFIGTFSETLWISVYCIISHNFIQCAFIYVKKNIKPLSSIKEILYNYVIQVHHKFVQSAKIPNKRRNARKIFCFRQYGQRHIGFLSMKKKISKSNRKRTLTRHTETFDSNNANRNRLPNRSQ